MKKTTKKILAGVLAGLLAVACLAGCGAGTQGGKTADGKIAISVGSWPADSLPALKEVYDGYLQSFYEKHNDIEVTPDEWDCDLQTFLPKASAGQLPNLYQCHLTETKSIVSKGYSADVTDLMKEYGWLDKIEPKYWELGMKDGKYYAIPTGAGYTFGTNCNVDLYKQAGLVDENGIPKFPDTMEEFRQTAKTIKDKTGRAGFVLCTTNNCGGWVFTNIAWNFGVNFMEEKDGKWVATFDSPECVKALQMIKDMKWVDNSLPENTLIDQAEMQKQFATGQAAMYFGGGAEGALFQTYGMKESSFAATTMPKGDGGRYGLLGGKSYCFATNSTDEQLKACFEWLKDGMGFRPVETEEEMNESLKKYEDQLVANSKKPGVIGLKTNSIWKNDELAAKQAEIREKYANIDLRMVEKYNNMEGVTVRPEEPFLCQQLYSVLDKAIQEVLTNKDADVAAVVKKACSDFQTNYLDKEQNK